MAWMKSRLRRPLILGMGLCLIALTGCRSPEGLQWGWPRQQGADGSYVVNRPSYSEPGTKNLYISTYAGDDHTPMRPRRRQVDGANAIPADSPANVTVNQGSWDTQ